MQMGKPTMLVLALLSTPLAPTCRAMQTHRTVRFWMLVVSGITLAIYLAARAWHDRGWLIRRIEGLDARTKELQGQLGAVGKVLQQVRRGAEGKKASEEAAGVAFPMTADGQMEQLWTQRKA